RRGRALGHRGPELERGPGLGLGLGRERARQGVGLGQALALLLGLAKLTLALGRLGAALLVFVPAAVLEQITGLLTLAGPLEIGVEGLAPLGIVGVVEVVIPEVDELFADLLGVGV